MSSVKKAYEAKLYQVYQNKKGFPKVYYFGKEHNRNTMVMQLCGKSLEALFQQCGCQFSLKVDVGGVFFCFPWTLL